ncbi:reverse transcriptase [Gossypium australe]|uniref:Reverse transcriptase n=1 Tax=Gossypium australe TaxID=47621 RepID=A0A5B6V0E3_9ROSI|nr:reverse transcriptase [Gossypium australe]
MLRRLRNQGEQPWLVCGDFNEILYGFEKKCGLHRDERKMEEFRQVLYDCHLADLGYLGNLSETNIQERLDRGVGTEGWRLLFPNFIIQHLPHSFSDHCPLLINTDSRVRQQQGKSFRFEAWWVLEDTFFEKVRLSWGGSSGDLLDKLEILKDKKLKKEVLTTKLAALLEADRDEENLTDIIDTKIHLNMEIDKDESYWEQRARINWLKLGDRNTTFFHKQATQRKKMNLIQKLQFEDGRETIESKDMEEIAGSYFVKLFSADSQMHKGGDLDSVDRNGSYKGPRGRWISSHFYQKYWPIIGEEVSNYCLQQLNNGNNSMDLRPIKKTNIVLLPKVLNRSTISQFRPISLCNVIYKLIARVLANRLRVVLYKCIDSAQSAFVPGRLITDNVLLAYEILHMLKNKKTTRKWLMAVKLDMSKAYDRVDWNFVKRVTIKLGFAMG